MRGGRRQTVTSNPKEVAGNWGMSVSRRDFDDCAYTTMRISLPLGICTGAVAVQLDRPMVASRPAELVPSLLMCPCVMWVWVWVCL